MPRIRVKFSPPLDLKHGEEVEVIRSRKDRVMWIRLAWEMEWSSGQGSIWVARERKPQEREQGNKCPCLVFLPSSDILLEVPNQKNKDPGSIDLIHGDLVVSGKQRERYLVETRYCGSMHIHEILPTVFSLVLLIPGTECYGLEFWSMERNISFEYLWEDGIFYS